VRAKLRTGLLSSVIAGGTVVLALGPLLAGVVLLGRQAGIPVGSGVAAVLMVTVLAAVVRRPDLPGGWIGGILSFALGILMLVLAPIFAALALIPSRAVGAVAGAAVGAGLVAGLVVFAKHRGLWSKEMGWPGIVLPPPGP
jgi:hypothetical protein